MTPQPRQARSDAVSWSDDILDLTMPITDSMAAYPGEPTAHFESFTTVANDKVAMSTVHLFSQIGTHVDAPAHFIDAARSVDEIDLGRCMGPAAVVRLGTLAPGFEITAQLLATHDSVIAAHRRILLQTGWPVRAGRADYFLNWPTLAEDAIDYVVAHDIVLLGLDTPSPGTDATNAALHQALLAKDIVLIECLVNTDRLPDSFELTCLPLPLVGLDGSPVRAVARRHQAPPDWSEEP